MCRSAPPSSHRRRPKVGRGFTARSRLGHAAAAGRRYEAGGVVTVGLLLLARGVVAGAARLLEDRSITGAPLRSRPATTNASPSSSSARFEVNDRARS